LSARVFHLAIPCRDLAEAERFYVEALGARAARRFDDRVSLELFGAQVVCHLAPEQVTPEPTMYPRHFGAALDAAEFDALLARLRAHGTPLWREVFVRFRGRPEEHRSFFVCDPSNNLVEVKHYADPAMRF
jgi:extradiol dioxygenase family protein